MPVFTFSGLAGRLGGANAQRQYLRSDCLNLCQEIGKKPMPTKSTDEKKPITVDGPVGLTAVDTVKLEQYQEAVSRFQQRVRLKKSTSAQQFGGRRYQRLLAWLQDLPSRLKNRF